VDRDDHPAVPWIVGAFAVIVVFGLTRHILDMSVQSIRRRILNQHVMLEVAAFAGLVGGAIGLIFRPEDYPTGHDRSWHAMVDRRGNDTYRRRELTCTVAADRRKLPVTAPAAVG